MNNNDNNIKEQQTTESTQSIPTQQPQIIPTPANEQFRQPLKLEGLTLGIIAMVFAVIMPIVTYICGGIGLSQANMQIRQNKNIPSTAKTLNITALIVTSCLVLLIFASSAA